MRKLKISLSFFFITAFCTSQPQQNFAGYDVQKERLLIQTVGLYFFTANQGVIDLDSAMIFAAKGEHLDVSLWYDEDYNTVKPLPAQQWIAEGKLFAAASLLPKMQNEDRILLLLELGGWYLHQTGTKAGDMNKAFTYLQEAAKESEAMHNYKMQNAALNLLGNYATQVNDTISVKQFFSQAMGVGRKMNDKLTLANTINNHAVSLSNYDSSKALLLYQALSLYRQLNNKEKQIKVLGELAGIYFVLGQPDSVITLTQQAIALENAIGFKHTHYSYNALAFVYLLKPDALAAFKASNTSVRIMEETQDTVLAYYFYLTQSQVYLNAERSDESLNVFYKVLHSYKQGPVLWYHLFINALDVLLGKAEYNETLRLIQEVTKKYPPQTDMDEMYVAMYKARTYQKLNQYSEAKKYWLLALQEADNIHNPEMDRDLANVYSFAAAYFSETNQYDKADIYLNKAEKCLSGRMSIAAKRQIDRVRYKVDSAKGNYLSALQLYQKFKNYEDSIYNWTSIKISNELVVKYETEKKEKDIQLLNGKNELQQAELANATVIRNTTLAGITVLLIIIALVYNQYRINRKVNKSIAEKNRSLAQLLDEKEWLLKEIHHRVKNNLHIITSLLESQSAYVKNDALAAIRDSQHRVYAMALIHQKLYHFDDMQTISCAEYLRELVSYLKESFDVESGIEFVVNIDAVKLDVSQAVPVGLIVNEAVTNAVKYAFSGKNKGQINISFKQPDVENIVLTISDNGIGLPAAFNIEKANSLGMKLIKGLSDDLDGKLSIETSAGTCIRIVFKILKLSGHILDPESAKTSLV